MSKQLDFYKIGENAHRRTYSNTVDNIKGIKAGHRRTMSNTAFDFAGIKIQSPPIANDEPQTPDSLDFPHKKPAQKQKKGFISLLNAALSYFNQEAQFPISFPPSEIDILKAQLENLKQTYKELEKTNIKITEDCENMENTLEDQQIEKKNLECTISELKKYTQKLETNFKQVNMEIKKESKRTEEIQALLYEFGNGRTSPFNQGTDESEKKAKKKNAEIDKPMPRPITYKPITQRGIRNSKDGGRK